MQALETLNSAVVLKAERLNARLSVSIAGRE